MNISPLSQPLVEISEIPKVKSSHKRQRIVQSQVTSATTAVFDNRATLPLIPKPVSANRTTPINRTPIALAVLNKQWSRVPELLNANSKFSANAMIYFNKQWTSILTATAGSGEWDLVSLMIEKDKRAKNSPYSKGNFTTGRTPLFYAMTNKQWNIVCQMLMQETIDISANSEIQDMPCPLFYVMHHDRWDLALLMLKHHNMRNIGPYKGDQTAVWYAADKKKWDVVSLMLDRIWRVNLNAAPSETPLQGRTLFWLTVAAGQWEIAKKMLSTGLHSNADIYAAPVEEPSKGVPVWRLVVDSQQWDLAARMLERHFIAKISIGNRLRADDLKQLKKDIYVLISEGLAGCSDEIKKILINYLILENVPHTGTTREYLEEMLVLKSILQKGLKGVSELLIQRENHSDHVESI